MLDMNPLFIEIRELILNARKIISRGVDLAHVLTNYEIGHRIVNHEQGGTERAEYGKGVLIELSTRLTDEFGRGFSRSNLEYMRKFYLVYQDRHFQKSQMASGKLKITEKSQMISGKYELLSFTQAVINQKDSWPFQLSWSQYVFLISIDNEDERDFYEIESAANCWTLPELKRQFNSGLYERLALSREKEEIQRLAREGQIVTRPQDILKDPYVLEFLGLEEKARYSETELETAIIDKLEHFLLELGKGFLFEARQKRFSFDEDHFFVDLVFYNRLLRCYVLIDLKIGKLTHQNLGQMQMYVNYFDRHVKLDHENPTIGIILCRKKHDALVEITLPENANIHASKYQLYLPSKEELRQKLIAWTEEREGIKYE